MDAYADVTDLEARIEADGAVRVRLAFPDREEALLLPDASAADRFIQGVGAAVRGEAARERIRGRHAQYRARLSAARHGG